MALSPCHALQLAQGFGDFDLPVPACPPALQSVSVIAPGYWFLMCSSTQTESNICCIFFFFKWAELKKKKEDLHSWATSTSLFFWRNEQVPNAGREKHPFHHHYIFFPIVRKHTFSVFPSTACAALSSGGFTEKEQESEEGNYIKCATFFYFPFVVLSPTAAWCLQPWPGSALKERCNTEKNKTWNFRGSAAGYRTNQGGCCRIGLSHSCKWWEKLRWCILKPLSGRAYWRVCNKCSEPLQMSVPCETEGW